MILLVLFCVAMFLWFLSLLPVGPLAGSPAPAWLAFISVLLVGLVVFKVLH